MAVITLNNSNFEEEVLKSDKPVLVDFFATWCGPCRMLSPLVEQLAEENTDIKVGKIDVDQEDEIVQKYGIEAMPTLLVFKNGEVVNKQVGFAPKDALLALVK